MAHTWGVGSHNQKQGASIFPEVMRWLWKDWKVPLRPNWDSSRSKLKDLVGTDSVWEKVSDGNQWAEGLATLDDGTLFISDVPAAKIYRITPDGTRTVWVKDSGQANGLAIGPDGRLYGACGGNIHQVRAWDVKTG